MDSVVKSTRNAGFTLASDHLEIECFCRDCDVLEKSNAITAFWTVLRFAFHDLRVHCLALPVAIVMMPALSADVFADEYFHLLLLYLVLPTSVIALGLGCRRHRLFKMMVWGGAGLCASPLPYCSVMTGSESLVKRA